MEIYVNTNTGAITPIHDLAQFWYRVGGHVVVAYDAAGLNMLRCPPELLVGAASIRVDEPQTLFTGGPLYWFGNKGMAGENGNGSH